MRTTPPRVTVITPVYDTAAYLERCLDSVLDSDLRDLEVLCVDDGSTDGSREILERYAAADARLRVLDSPAPRSGPGAARNRAMAVAQGDYIACVDSDDHIDASMLSRMVAVADDSAADVTMCLLVKFSDTDPQARFAACTYDRYIPTELDSDTFTWRDLPRPFQLRFASCNKLYRRSFLDHHAIRYSEGIFFEDMVFTYRALLQADRLRLVREGLYFNRKDREGATTFVQSGRVFGALTAMEQLDGFLRSDEAYAGLLDQFAEFRFRKLLGYLHKNDAEHLPAYFDALKTVASDPALDSSPHLSAALAVRRDVVLRSDHLGYLLWELWATKQDLRRSHRKAKRLRHRLGERERQLGALQTRNQRLEVRNATLKERLEKLRRSVHRSFGYRAEQALRAGVRPLTRRLRG